MIYYDVTDLLNHFRKSTRVVGIPRVSIVTLQSLQKAHPGQYRLIAWRPGAEGPMTVDADFFGSNDIDAASLCRHFGLDYRAPSTLDTYVQRRYKTKFGRKFHKLRLRLENWLSRGRKFKRKGFVTTVVEPVDRAVWKKPALGAGDVVFLPGAIWGYRDYLDWLGERRARDGVKIVQTVHDLSPLFGAGFFPQYDAPHFENWLAGLAGMADAVFTVSKATRDDYQRFLRLKGLPDMDVRITPLAHELIHDVARDENGDPLLEYRQIGAQVLNAARLPYALCVGTMEVRKNNWGALRVWQSLLAKRGLAMPRLVFAGKKGWLNEEFDALLARTDNLGGIVKIVDGPSDAELAHLYRNCLFSIYPSFFEGWGLPIGESLWFGRPVVASSISSMPEVAGSFVDYADPYRLPELEAAIEKMLDESYRETRVEAIKTMKPRRWSDYAEDVWANLDSMAPTS